MVKIRINSLYPFVLKGIADDLNEEDTELLVWVLTHSLYRDQLEELAEGVERRLEELAKDDPSDREDEDDL